MFRYYGAALLTEMVTVAASLEFQPFTREDAVCATPSSLHRHGFSERVRESLAARVSMDRLSSRLRSSDLFDVLVVRILRRRVADRLEQARIRPAVAGSELAHGEAYAPLVAEVEEVRDPLALLNSSRSRRVSALRERRRRPQRCSRENGLLDRLRCSSPIAVRVGRMLD